MSDAGWLNAVSNKFSALFDNVADWVPQLLVALLLLVFGWLLARWLRRLSNRLMERLDNYWHHMVADDKQEHMPTIHTTRHFVGEVLFWLVMLLFAMLVINLMGWAVVGEWLAYGLSYLPVLLLSGAVLVTGLLLGRLAHRLILSVSMSAGTSMAQAQLFGRIVQVSLIVLAAVIAVAQLGVDVSLLSMLVAIILAAVLGAIALAFGVGSRGYVANVLAAQEIRRRYQPGDTVRILEYEGRVVSILSTLVVLETELGELSLPSYLFAEHASLLVSSEGERDE